VKLCYVTDRKTLAGTADEQIRALLEEIAGVASAGVHWIQVREKDLPGRILAALVSEAIERVPPSCRIIVNDRWDVTFALGAAGVHLSGQSLPAAEVKRFLRERKVTGDFLVGVSAHSLEAALAAEQAGAGYVIFGPVFATPSKARFGQPQGIERLADVCERTRLPVIAIGGITADNAGQCMAAGAAGIAAIRLFQETSDLAALVRRLRAIEGRV
jgi:thiamine-phosphate pyrophosphorylase